jgi:hypothetical protein
MCSTAYPSQQSYEERIDQKLDLGALAHRISYAINNDRLQTI